MRIQKPQKKLYYSIKQVSEMLGISDNIIKGWEKEFPQVKPMRNRAGNRYYLDKDIELLFHIKRMLFEEKLSIPETQNNLKEKKTGDDNRLIKLQQALAEIRLEINEILDIIEK